MTEQERKAKERELINALTNPDGCIIRDGSRHFNTKDSAMAVYSFSLLNDAIAFMYVLFHLCGLFQPELYIVNPNPSKPTGDYVLPRDFYLLDEQSHMEKMKLDEFVVFGNDLIMNKKVPCIGVGGGMFGKDFVRANALLLTDPKFAGEMAQGRLPVIISFVGGTALKNESAKNELNKKVNKALQSFTY